MGDYVELKNKQGCFHDPETGFVLTRDDSKELTEPVGKLTQERLASGALVRSKPKQEACQETSGAVNAEESVQEQPAQDEPAEASGQGDGQEADGAADHGVEKAAPAPRKKHASKRKVAK